MTSTCRYCHAPIDSVDQTCPTCHKPNPRYGGPATTSGEHSSDPSHPPRASRARWGPCTVRGRVAYLPTERAQVSLAGVVAVGAGIALAYQLGSAALRAASAVDPLATDIASVIAMTLGGLIVLSFLVPGVVFAIVAAVLTGAMRLGFGVFGLAVLGTRHAAGSGRWVLMRRAGVSFTIQDDDEVRWWVWFSHPAPDLPVGEQVRARGLLINGTLHAWSIRRLDVRVSLPSRAIWVWLLAGALLWLAVLGGAA